MDRCRRRAARRRAAPLRLLRPVRGRRLLRRRGRGGRGSRMPSPSRSSPPWSWRPAGIVLVRPRVSAALRPATEGTARAGVHGGLRRPGGGHARRRRRRRPGRPRQSRRRAVAGDQRRRRRRSPPARGCWSRACEGTTLIVWPVGGHLPSPISSERTAVRSSTKENRSSRDRWHQHRRGRSASSSPSW